MRKTLSIIHEEGLLLLGVSFLVGHSGSSFISSVINNMVMPFISRAFSEAHWEHAHVVIHEVKITWGEPLSTALHFVIVIYIATLALRFLKKQSD